MNKFGFLWAAFIRRTPLAEGSWSLRSRSAMLFPRKWHPAFAGIMVCLILGSGMLLSNAALGEDLAPVKGDKDASEETSSDRIARDIQFLSSDALKGRAVGSEEIAKAGEMIAERFADLGLRTDLYDDKPFQYFTLETGIDVGEADKNTLRFTSEGGQPIELELGKSFNPLSLGASGSVSSELVFVGYGITAPTASYDEYANIDAKGKVVVILRKEPRSGQPNNPLGKNSPTASAYFSTKVLNAVTHGAAGILIVNDRNTVADLKAKANENEGELSSEQQEALEHSILKVGQAGRGRGKKVPSMSVSRKVIDQLVQKAVGKTLLEIEEAIDRDFQPRSAVISGVRVEMSTDLKKSDVKARNVIAELPGTGSLAQETIVVGAHYDHVGMGGMGSLAPGTIAVHNGADDNASGTAALLEIARAVVEKNRREQKDHRRVVFIAFTGEERGLLGSAHYVREPRFDLEKTVAMFNLDMVGRLKGNVLSVYGTGTATNFDSMIRELNKAHKFKLDIDPSGYGPSDHQSFYEKKIPVLHFFTGLHNDYHRPSDDFDKINLAGLVRITDIVTEVTHQAATSASPPQYQSTNRGKGIRTQKTGFLGVQLRMNGDQLTISSVVDNGPASQGGLQAGDVLLQANQTKLASIQDMLGTLANKSGGDKLEFTVLRGGREIKVTVTLGER